MNYKFLVVISSFFINSFVYSQQVKDDLSDQSIPFVEIYADNGSLIGITDVDGLFSIDLKNKIETSNTKKLTFVNSFFETKIFERSAFNSSAVFKMNSIVNQLNEVVVLPKKDKNNYLVLRAYVRSLQINNERIHYFMDGIVEYYISLKTNKVKIKFLSNRSFENKTIKQLKDKGITKMYFQIAGAPMLSEFIKYHNLSEKYNLEKNDLEIEITDKIDNTIKGKISTNKNGSNLSLGLISHDKPKIMKALGVENILEDYSINSLHNTSNSEEIGFNNLMYFKEVRNYKIKAKKDVEFQKVDATHEVFVLNYRFSEEIDAKKLDTNYSFINSSSYSEDYWKKIDSIIFQPLAESIQLFIEKNLTKL